MLRGSITLSSSLPTCGGVAGGDLALADDAVEGRAHLGAAQLLARRRRRAPRAAASSLCALLRRTSASSSACTEVMPWRAASSGARTWRSACSKRLRRRARRRLGRAQAVADRGVVQAHQQIAAAHRLAVFLQHLQHHGRHLGAQVGALLRLDRAGDDRARAGRRRAQRARSSGDNSRVLAAAAFLAASGAGPRLQADSETAETTRTTSADDNGSRRGRRWRDMKTPEAGLWPAQITGARS